MRNRDKLLILMLFLALVTAEVLLLPRLITQRKEKTGVVVVHDEEEEEVLLSQTEPEDNVLSAISAKEVEGVTSKQLEEMTRDMKIVFVGDSRTVQMKNAVGKNNFTWIAEAGQGYYWFVNTALSQVNAQAAQDVKILINLGVNDVTNVDRYAERINRSISDWTDKGATVYYASVNPVGNYPGMTNEKIDAFNERLKEQLDERVKWIDSNTYLKETGYATADGLHYRNETYQTLYIYYLLQLEDAE